MISALDVVGNPSSIHLEGRAAQVIIEKARSQISHAFGVGAHDIVFTSGATEAAALALHGREFEAGGIEHEAVSAWVSSGLNIESGKVTVKTPEKTALQMANSETGIIQTLPKNLGFSDMTQAFGKIPTSFAWTGANMACASAHKLGGPKGIGCLLLKPTQTLTARMQGGGQERGRRAGTENVVGIAGFGAAAEAAAKDLADEKWNEIAKLRNILEETLEASGKPITYIGRDVSRLPNTACFSAPGWKGETQVMQMDLAGFAISAGSACSSGKVKSGRVLKSMGYETNISNSAIRVSLGLSTTEIEIQQFATTWLSAYDSFLARRAA
jgi:cysteine desulfurase